MTTATRHERSSAQLGEVLGNAVANKYGAGTRVANLEKLSGGASRETWSFDAQTPQGVPVPLILKRDPVFYQPDGSIATEESHLGVSRATEGRVMELAGEAGTPVPDVVFYLDEDERTSAGFVMQRLAGEALGLRIIKSDALVQARSKLAFQCGHAAARLHSVPLDVLPPLESMDVRAEIAYQHELLSSADHPYPGFEYGFRWLEEHVELAGENHALVHGDFRNGNILVDPNGLQGVVDWELAHLGNPLNDLGWICVRSWRYGHLDKPVGGFGEISELQAGYDAGGGGRVGDEAIRYWEIFGTLRWGMICIDMAFDHINGPNASLEKAAIGRRAAETEYDLLQLID